MAYVHRTGRGIYKDKRCASGKADVTLAHGATRVAICEREVPNGSEPFEAHLAGAGGIAVWLVAR